MFFVYLGTYILILLVIWGFFAITKIHAYKFRSFSAHIVGVTNILLIFLLVLSILGVFFIFKMTGSDVTFFSVSTGSTPVKQDINY